MPVVETPGEDEVNVGSAEAVYSNAPLATVQDRRNIEGAALTDGSMWGLRGR